MSPPLCLYQIEAGHAHDKPPFPKFSINFASFFPGGFQLICACYITLTPPTSYNKGKQHKKIIKMDISAVIKFLFVVSLSVLSGVFSQIQHDNDALVLDFMVELFTQKPSPQQCREIMSSDIISTVNHIGSMKTWGKSSCTLCMKEKI